MPNSARYAIYYAPDPVSALWRFGSEVIGYDAVTGAELPARHSSSCLPSDWSRITADPRRYGFHATIKAPFRLAHGCDEAGLLSAFDTFCAATRSAHIDRLEVCVMSRFIALTVDGSAADVGRLADETVRAFEPFRLPLTVADRARRLIAPLSPRQIGYLDAYGYPYVMDEFRFHMTLAGPIAAPCRDQIARELRAEFATCAPAGPFAIDTLCVFRQMSPQTPFRVIRRAALRG